MQVDNMLGNDVQLSLSKGGVFKAVLGLKTSLNVVFSDEGGRIKANATVGIFGKQAIPTMITLFIVWPVLLTQIVGLVKQMNLDGHVMDLVDKAIFYLSAEHNLKAASENGVFCPDCGVRISGGKFCPECGARLS